MTNTETLAGPAAEFTPEQKDAYRSDIVGFIEDLPPALHLYSVIDVGRIRPGDRVGYTTVTVLRDRGDEFVVTTLVRVDDRAGGLRWDVWSGDYFYIPNYESREAALRAATERLHTRKY